MVCVCPIFRGDVGVVSPIDAVCRVIRPCPTLAGPFVHWVELAYAAADEVVVWHSIVYVVVALLRIQPYFWLHVRMPPSIGAIPP